MYNLGVKKNQKLIFVKLDKWRGDTESKIGKQWPSDITWHSLRQNKKKINNESKNQQSVTIIK